MPFERPIKLTIAALGGQGGGVLASWLVGIAESEGYLAQATSVPGVAQRTGATIYYLEFFPQAVAAEVGRDPVMALMPASGDVDCVLASELAEAARAIQRGLVTRDRTTLIASSHRSYAIAEKSAMGDGTADEQQLLELVRTQAKRTVLFDMDAVAEQHHSVISSVMLGALGGSGVLPFRKAAFEAAIKKGGIAVSTNLAAFQDAYQRAAGSGGAIGSANAAGSGVGGGAGAAAGAGLAVGSAGGVGVAGKAETRGGLGADGGPTGGATARAGRAVGTGGGVGVAGKAETRGGLGADGGPSAGVAAGAGRGVGTGGAVGVGGAVAAGGGPSAGGTAGLGGSAGTSGMADGGHLTLVPEKARSPKLQPLLDRVRRLPQPVQPVVFEGVRRAIDYQDPAYAGLYLDRVERVAAIDGRGWDLTEATARSLALWMTFEDTIRVADLKTRPTRFTRVRDEIRAEPGQLFGITEFMKPRVQEIAGTLPVALGRWVLRSPRVSGWLSGRTGGKRIRTGTVGGFLFLHTLGGLKRWRRRTLRYQEENERIEQWLGRIERLTGANYALAVELARAQRLVKGYGETHERGWRNFSALVAKLDELAPRSDGAALFARLHAAALADEEGKALERELAEISSVVVEQAALERARA